MTDVVAEIMEANGNSEFFKKTHCHECKRELTEKELQENKHTFWGLCFSCKEEQEEKALFLESHCANCRNELNEMERQNNSYGLLRFCSICYWVKMAEERERYRKKADHDRLTQGSLAIPFLYLEAKPDITGGWLDAQNVLVYGNFGTGKTYGGYSCLKYYWEHCECFAYNGTGTGGIPSCTIPLLTRAFGIMAELKGAIPKNEVEKVFKKYTSIPLLIIDEYGKNQGSNFEDAYLFEIINTRNESGLRTILIVNASTKADLVKLIRPDILDRFRGGLMEINGRSRR